MGRNERSGRPRGYRNLYFVIGILAALCFCAVVIIPLDLSGALDPYLSSLAHWLSPLASSVSAENSTATADSGFLQTDEQDIQGRLFQTVARGMNPHMRKLILLILGWGAGILLAVFGGIFLLDTRVDRISTSQTATNLVSAEETLLAQANAFLVEGQPGRVPDLLWPEIQKWSSLENRAEGYRLLGQAEMELGHPQLAAGYYEELTYIHASAGNLFLLGYAYDAGGHLGAAYVAYKRVIAAVPSDPEVDYEFVSWRIEQLEEFFGIPTETPTSARFSPFSDQPCSSALRACLA